MTFERLPASVVRYRESTPEGAGARAAWQEQLFRRANLCSSALSQARSLVAAGMFGPLLSRQLVRACELLDEMDEILVAIDPRRNRDAFARAADLHRSLEDIQSRLPRRYRRLRPMDGTDRSVHTDSRAPMEQGN